MTETAFDWGAMVDVVVLSSIFDAALTSRIAQQLKSLGLDVEIEGEDRGTVPGPCGALLVCWSAASVSTPAITEKARIGFDAGKLLQCRLGPCMVPPPFGSYPIIDLGAMEESDPLPPDKLVAAVSEKLARPGLIELAKARNAKDEAGLYAFAKRFPDEPEARRIFLEYEARYRQECEEILGDARRSLEGRAAAEKARIEAALESFRSDFSKWVENERQGGAAPKPGLGTLQKIWLGQAARAPAFAATADAPADSLQKRVADLQQNLEALSARTERLEQHMQAAAQKQSSSGGAGAVADVSREGDARIVPAAAPPRTRLPWGLSLAVLAFAAGILSARVLSGAFGPEPTAERLEERLSAALKQQKHRGEIVALVTGAAGDDALRALLDTRKDATIAAAVKADPPAAAAALAEIARPEQLVEGFSTALKQDKSKIIEKLVAAAPEQAAHALALRDPGFFAAQALKASPSTVIDQLTQLPPQELAAMLRAHLPAARSAELAKLLENKNAQPSQPFKVFDNWDVESTDAIKLKTADTPACSAACGERSACKAYSYDKWNHICYLKPKVVAFKLNPRSTSGVRAGVEAPPAPSGAVTMERYPAKAFPGSGYKSIAVDAPASCERICQTESACVAYTFYRDERACRLFGNTGEYFSNRAAESGGKRQD